MAAPQQISLLAVSSVLAFLDRVFANAELSHTAFDRLHPHDPSAHNVDRQPLLVLPSVVLLPQILLLGHQKCPSFQLQPDMKSGVMTVEIVSS